MGAVHRRAMRKDANRLYDVRRRSILELAPPVMPAAEAAAWASQLTPFGMEQKLRELEVWVAELNGVIAGWGAIHGDKLEGLYAAPEFAGQGIGAGLLDMLEGLIREREFPLVRADASSNARDFYRSSNAERRLAHRERNFWAENGGGRRISAPGARPVLAAV